jgi:uncharacterized membrane protein
MGQEEFRDPAERYGNDLKLTAEVAALSARVEALEREIAALKDRKDDSTTKSSAVSLPLASSDAVVFEKTAPPPVSQPPSPQAATSFENKLGAQIFNRVGVIALLFGATWFLKLAMDNHWIGPIGRIVAGLISGAGVIVWSELFRRKGFFAFSYSLKAIGSGVLYLALWAAFHLYHLLPAEAALGAMILVTAWNAYMAWAQDSELLAAYAVAGGLATPLLLSMGGNHEIFLFTYLLAIDLATVVLIRLKPWPRLLLAAFPATVAYFIGWYVEFYKSEDLLVTSIFIVLFFLVFASVSIDADGIPDATGAGSRRTLKVTITEILLPMANAAFVSLALYSALQDSGHHVFLPWLMIILAAIYLGLMRLPQGVVAATMHLSLAIVFLTIAIPLKASGHWITVGWFVEGVALLWVASRFATTTESSLAHSSWVLRWLASGALLLGVVGLFSLSGWFDTATRTPFFNADFATSLVGIAALAIAAWIAIRVCHHVEASARWLLLAGASIIAINLIAVLSGVREINALWARTATNFEADLQRALAVSGFLMAYGAALLAVGFWRRTAFIRWQALILIVFTIAKTFLYDMRNLSQGYRVVSFLCLGVLLMAISFAYQKDWLALRDSEADQHSGTRQ